MPPRRGAPFCRGLHVEYMDILREELAEHALTLALAVVELEELVRSAPEAATLFDRSVE